MGSRSHAEPIGPTSGRNFGRQLGAEAGALFGFASRFNQSTFDRRCLSETPQQEEFAT
jgi:hypothetical protein